MPELALANEENHKTEVRNFTSGSNLVYAAEIEYSKT
jgi:hypothetical protein